MFKLVLKYQLEREREREKEERKERMEEGKESDTIFNMGKSDDDDYYYYYYQLFTAGFKAYCAIWARRSNFRHQESPRVSPRESTQRRKVELWARNVR